MNVRIIFLAALFCVATCLFAQGQAVKVTYQISITNDIAKFEIYLLSPAEQIVFLGNSVFEVTYNDEKLALIGKDPAMDGLWDEDNSSSYYDTFATSIGNRAIFRVLYNNGQGVPVPSSQPARVGCLLFQLKDQFNAGDIQWMAPFCILSDVQETKLAVDVEQ
jgi:hypothetical protein